LGDDIRGRGTHCATHSVHTLTHGTTG